MNPSDAFAASGLVARSWPFTTILPAVGFSSPAIIRMVDMGPEVRNAIGARGRERVARHFSLDVVVERYEELYRTLAADLPLSSDAAEVRT